VGSPEGDVPVNSNIDDPVLAAGCGLVDHVMCHHA
jgi:hypothetical protein